MREALVAVAAVGALVAAGCTTPCSSLRAHAEICGAVASSYVDERDSHCIDVRREFGTARFDAYAECVTDAECKDTGVIDRCMQQTLGSRSPCDRYRLWAAACGLEPAGTEDRCNNVGFGLTKIAFEGFVECVTADGCPVEDDPRFESCPSAVLPAQINTLIEACQLVQQWTTDCEGLSPIVQVSRISLPECLAQAQPFTSESYFDYANCQIDLACDDVAGRANCFFELRFLPDDRIAEQCERLLDYTLICGGLDLASTQEACEQSFLRVTADSFDVYIECIEALPCGELDAGNCFAELELQ